MPYIGNTSPSRFVSNRAASVFSGDGSTTAFTLEQAVTQDEDVLVSVDGVIQEPSVAYAVSNGTTLTFTAAPSSNSGNNIFVYYLASQVGTVGHPSNQALSATTGTFTGDVTVDTSTLKVDSANNRVGVGTASPSHVLHTSGTGQTAKFESSNNGLQVEFNYNNGTSRAFMGTFSNGLSLAPSSASTAINIDTNGHVTKPLQCAFLVVPASEQTNLNNSTENIDFGTEKFDQNGDFAGNTFTAPVTGKYQFNFMGRIDNIDTAANWQRMVLVTSNTTYESQIIDLGGLSSDPSYWNFSIQVLADMDANDTAYIRWQQNGGATQADGTTQMFFSGYLVA